MEETKQNKLFREKSLEAIESPERLDDYLRVTSPGVWLILAAVIAVLIGGILWGIFGRIPTTAHLAVTMNDGQAFCYVPYNQLDKIMKQETVTVDGRDYALNKTADIEVMIISEGTNPYIRVAGRLNIGDVVALVPLNGTLADGVYTGSVVTENLQPLSLLFSKEAGA